MSKGNKMKAELGQDLYEAFKGSGHPDNGSYHELGESAYDIQQEAISAIGLKGDIRHDF